MLEHVNLLPRRLRAPASLLWGLTATALLLLGLGGYGWWLARDVRSQRLQMKALESELGQLRTELARRNSEDPAAQKAALEALRHAAAGYEPLVMAVRNGSLGSREGFVNTLSALQRADTPEVWLQQVGMSGETKKLEITGRATSERAALAYRTKLLPLLDAHAPLENLDMQLEPATSGAQGMPASYVFKLR